MSVEFLGKVIETATLGNLTVRPNPDFAQLWQKVLSEKRSFMTRIYDAGTLIIIDDENHRIVPRFNLVRKK
jgi:hypothetical protein